MNVDPVTANVLVGVLGAAVGVIGKTALARTARGSAEDTALARVLERVLDDARRLQDRLDQSHTSETLATGQVGDLGARVEMLEERDRVREAEIAELREKNEECEQARNSLTRRVYKLETKGVTPHNDTPAVESGERLARPITQGGYRVRNPG